MSQLTTKQNRRKATDF
jgi:hypothetical protein